jgi:hypothetical protein
MSSPPREPPSSKSSARGDSAEGIVRIRQLANPWTRETHVCDSNELFQYYRTIFRVVPVQDSDCHPFRDLEVNYVKTVQDYGNKDPPYCCYQ